MNNFFNNKNNIIIGLCAILILMGIGFAAFSQRLDIGDTVATSSDWNVYIKSVIAGTPVGKATGSGEVIDRASAKLTANLQSPGDSVTYTITVANDGNVDAVLDVITLSASNSDSVIKYSYSGIEEDEELLAESEKSFAVTIEYDSTKTGTAIAEQKQNTLTLNLDYIQKTSGSGIDTSVQTLTTADLKNSVVTSGDGLYTDANESGRYVYRGANPNNYIWLDLNGDDAKTDNETYRIVAVDSDNTIKVVAQNSLGNIPFDPGYTSEIDGITSASSTTGTRYSKTSTYYCYQPAPQAYWGCNVWGSKKTMLDSLGNNVTQMPWKVGNSTTYTLPTTESYLNIYLNTTFLDGIDLEIKNKIAIHIYNVGLLKSEEGQTLETDMSQESTYKWKGKIALINATDYVKASTNTACTNIYEYRKTTACYNNSETHNYLFHSSNEWTLSSRSDMSAAFSSNYVWGVSLAGSIIDTFINNSNYGVFPSFYLASNITLSGKGIETEPYEIVLDNN